MGDFFYAICNAFCAMTMGWQLLVALICVLICAGIIYLSLWALRVLLYRLLERMGLEVEGNECEAYEADWMDYEAWGRG